MKTIESYLADILSQGQRIEINCIAQLSAVKWISSSLANLEMMMQKRTSTLAASISVLASVSVVASALYLLGIMTGHVDATQSAKGLVSNLLDDKEIAHKLDLMVERMTGKAISSANPFRKFLNWLLAREEQDPAALLEEKLREDALDCWASWASTFAFLVMSVLRPYGGYTVSEEMLWLCLGLIGVKHERENVKLLDILVREGFVMRDDSGCASLDTVVYFFVEK
uniref:Uncharacterized protein n=1 Tax=Oryza meridionalis TaxID=40149 RepID=A0A0E0E7H8_9ORYZ